MDKKLNLIGAVAMLVGAMIGAAVFVLLGPLANITGRSLPLSFLLGALPAFFGSAYYIQLGSMFPSSGGTYVYTSRLLNPMFGILAAFWMLFAGVGATGMLALGFVNYIEFYVGSLPVQSVAIFIVIAFVTINLFGIRFSTLIQLYMVVWLVGALLMYIVFGFIGQVDGALLTVDHEPFLRNGVTGLFMAAVLSFYSYAGYGLITEIGDEIANPQKNTPRAILISLIVVTIIYMGVAHISTTIIPINEFIHFSASLPMAAAYFLPTWAVHIIAIAGLLALFTSLNAMLLIFPHELYVMAKDSVVPRIFLLKSNTFRTPYASLLLVSFITIVLIRLQFSGTVFASMTVTGMLLASVLMGFAALNIFKKAPTLYDSAVVKIPKILLICFTVIGIVSSLLFTIWAMVEQPIVGILTLAVGCFSILYSTLPRNNKRVKTLDIDHYFHNLK